MNNDFQTRNHAVSDKLTQILKNHHNIHKLQALKRYVKHNFNYNANFIKLQSIG